MIGNYYIFRNGQHVGFATSEEAGRRAIDSMIEEWRRSGARGHSEYKLAYNGTGEVVYYRPAAEFNREVTP